MAGRKRKYGGPEGGGARGGKRGYGLQLYDLKSGPALLITTDTYKEKNGTAECLNLLNEYCDRLFPKEEDKAADAAAGAAGGAGSDESGAGAAAAAGAGDGADGSGGGSFSDMLKAEVEKVKNKRTWRFNKVDTGTKGIVILQILDAKIDPLKLVTAIMEDVAKARETRTRFTVRMLPLQACCHADAQAVIAAATPFVKAAFEGRTGVRWGIRFKARSGKTLARDETINGLADVVGEGHVVDLDNPEVCIIVESLKMTAGVCVVPNGDLARLGGFNVRTLSTSEEELKRRADETRAAQAAAAADAAAKKADAAAASAAAADAGAEAATPASDAPAES